MNVGIIGNFTESKDGQTIKTKELERSLIRRFEKLNIVRLNGDKYKSWRSFFYLPFDIFSMLLKCRVIIIILSSRGFKAVLPIILFLNFLFNREIYDFVIGGSRYIMLEKSPFTKMLNQSITKSYVELPNMVKEYKKLGITNCECMYNFKNLKKVNNTEMPLRTIPPYKLCIFSRISKEKGIEEAIEGVTAVNKNFGGILYELHLFGQIDRGYVETFEEKKRGFPSYIIYNGVVDFNQSTDTLKYFDALIFPSFWTGEGFPGTIIDAFFSGVPVIASDWNYNPYIIENNVTGRIFKTHNVEELAQILEFYANNIGELHRMRINCLKEAENYLPENALKSFFEEISALIN